MTTKPSERLKNIEMSFKERLCREDMSIDDIFWLIARVKRITEALEKIAGPLDATSPYRQEIAAKALEEE